MSVNTRGVPVTLQAFHNQSALKDDMLVRVINARRKHHFRQGGCHNHDNLQRTCAVSVMLGTELPSIYDFEPEYGLSRIYGELVERLFESMPLEIATVLPECVVRATALGADTSTIGWKVLDETLREHEGSDHRIVKKGIGDVLFFTSELAASRTVDIISAKEVADRCEKLVETAHKAVARQNHPVWKAAVMAHRAALAAVRMWKREADDLVYRALIPACETEEKAIVTARRMVRHLLADNPSIAGNERVTAFLQLEVSHPLPTA